MRRDHGRFVDAGAAVVAIGQGTSKHAADFVAALGLPFPMLADPARRGYAAYGLVEGDAAAFLNAETGRSVVRALRGGARGGRIIGNARQLPGSFVIDRAGLVRYARPGGHASDTPSTNELIAALPMAS